MSLFGKSTLQEQTYNQIHLIRQQDSLQLHTLNSYSDRSQYEQLACNYFKDFTSAMASYSWDKPRCLIEHSKEKGMHINELTIEMLRQVNLPIDAVAIVGLYRTGKSFLMNRLAGTNTGFDLGSTVQGKTKGIWIWCRPHPVYENCCLLLMDTEGLGDPERGSKDYDIWIFVLAVLLSNMLVYNSRGTIDQGAIEKIHFITDIAKHVKVKSGSTEEEEELNEYFPNFTWAVRDFHLKMEIDGKTCTQDEYMEHALKSKPGFTPEVANFNLPRDCLKHYFQARKCFVFPLPLKDMEKISEMESLTEADFNDKFCKVAQEFTDYIAKNSQPKTIHGEPVNGNVLATLCTIYVKAIRDGVIPCIENAVDSMANTENTKAIETGLQHYKTKMQKVDLPVDSENHLANSHQKCKDSAIEVFRKSAVFDAAKAYEKKFIESIEKEYKKFQREDEKLSRQTCWEIIDELYGSVEARQSHYRRSGGYKTYKADMKKLQEKYNEKSGKGLKADEVLEEFLESKVQEAELFKHVDEELTAEQNRRQEEEENARIARERERQAKEEHEELQRKMKEEDERREQREKEIREEHQRELCELEKKREENRAMPKDVERFVKETERVVDDVVKVAKEIPKATVKVADNVGKGLKKVFKKR